MEKDQLDSLATVAVGSEKMPPSHSHYAASEVYSASESPPAYTRPPMKSTAVQISRIIGTTMIAISTIIGSFILASAWLQSRASCTPESIAAMQTQLNIQPYQNEYIKHLQPEALVQDRHIAKNNLQSLSDPLSTTDKDEIQTDTKDIKIKSDVDGDSKSDNDNGDQSDTDDDYDDSEFPPVHIKLPLQLDLDDLAGSLLQQAHNIVSCVVERRRPNELVDEDNINELNNNNNTERQRMKKLSGERVAILCESGEPRQEQQEQEMLTPIIIPLGTVQIPLQPQDGGYNRYQVYNQYQVPESQRQPMPVDTKGMNAPFPMGFLPPELRNFAQVSMEMGPPARTATHSHIMQQQPVEMRQIPIEIRRLPSDPVQGVKLPAEQDQFIREQQQRIPMRFAHVIRPSMMNLQVQQTQGMMPPPPPSSSQSAEDFQQQIIEPRIPSMIERDEQKQDTESQEVSDRLNFPFRGIPIEFRKFIQQVPLEINNIIQHITGEARSVQAPVSEGAPPRVQVQEFKPIPEGIRPIPLDPFSLPIQVRNLIEHGNIQGHPQQNTHESKDRQPQSKSFPSSEEQSEGAEKQFPVPANVMKIIHQVVEGNVFPVPRFAMPLRSMDSLEVPVEAQAQVSDNQAVGEESQQQEEHQNVPEQPHHQVRMMIDHEEMQDETNRPHFVQPRSVRSVPEAFEHPREKRVRRCACNCAC